MHKTLITRISWVYGKCFLYKADCNNPLIPLWAYHTLLTIAVTLHYYSNVKTLINGNVTTQLGML